MKIDIINPRIKICGIIIIIWLLSSCSWRTPPIELAPNGEIVKRAIALQLSQTEQTLARQLSLNAPEIDLSNIRVQKLQPLFVAKLPTYHLQGKYNLKLKLTRRQITQNNNSFDVYLQRQAEGKTWRLLKKDNQQRSLWSSYLIDLQSTKPPTNAT
jgi:small-conductance mechanosensitive channel